MVPCLTPEEISSALKGSPREASVSIDRGKLNFFSFIIAANPPLS